MKILITGGAGVLGSALACHLANLGYDIDVLDIVRPEEAWRLQCIDDYNNIKYIWKSELDIDSKLISGYNVIIDVAISVADRPFATHSPLHSAIGNILPSLRLLEAAKHVSPKPVIIYPSSFNALYGNGDRIYTENTPPSPTSVYGWTKAAVELLYSAYAKAYDLPVIIVRTASTFGPKGRSDEFPHRIIIHALLGAKKFTVRSPYAKRLWTYVGDVLDFYKTLLEQIDDVIKLDKPITLHVAGNRGDVIHENIEFARLILRLMNSDMELLEGQYEPGELINGKPISFKIDSTYTRRLLGWKPKFTVEDGLKETIKWFRENIDRYLLVTS